MFILLGCETLFYSFFWAIPRHLNFICRRYGTMCSETPACKSDGGESPKKKKAYDIQNTAKVLKSRMCILSFKIFIISDTNSKSHFTSYYSIINWQPNSPPSRDFFFFNWSPIIAHYNNRHIPSSCVAAILKVAFRKQVLYNAFFAPLTTSYVNYDLIVEMDNLPSIIPQCYYWCDRNRKVPFFFLLSP